MKRALLVGIPALLLCLAVALTYVLAQPFGGPGRLPGRPPGGAPGPVHTDNTYQFKLGPDITDKAADVEITPAFKAVADDQFPYECYYNADRSGTTTDGADSVEAFRIKEAWTDLFSLTTTEDPLDGRKDLLLRLGFDMIQFTVDNGDARYAGFIAPTNGDKKAGFKEILPDGKRSDVTNIPGWAGINASVMEANRSSQARDYAGSACFSVDDTGRLYNETYFADWGKADQTNYPGRLQEPLALALAVQPEFAKDAKLKIGATVKVRRRFPVSAALGATAEYDFTYKLEKLYGTVDEPTSARFSFEAVPVEREHSQAVNGMTCKFTAPDIKGGHLLMDLSKGVAAWVSWNFEVSGTVTQPGTTLSTAFSVKVDFSASLREVKQPD